MIVGPAEHHTLLISFRHDQGVIVLLVLLVMLFGFVLAVGRGARLRRRRPLARRAIRRRRLRRRF